MIDRLARSLWRFRVPRRPSDSRWQIWQVHGFAHVDGNSGKVDLDIARPASQG